MLAACGSPAHTAAPNWEPSPSLAPPGGGGGAQASPILPTPSAPRGSGGGGSGRGSGGGAPVPGPSQSRAGHKHIDPLVVATHLVAPVGLTMLPDGTALVGERTTGRIVRVQPRAGQPVPTVRVLPGLDTAGDGGLLDLALSPTFDEDGLIYAYVTTRHDNRVVDFTMKGPVTPVFTGIPKGRTDNTGRIVFGGDGDLYIGTGDAGHPALAKNPRSLAGKVLRVDPIGDPARGNPKPGSPVWTSGHRVVDGLCPVPRSDYVLEAEAGTARIPDEVNMLQDGGFYGWPAPRAGAEPPIGRLPNQFAAAGGCAVLNNRIWVTSLDGQALLSAPLQANGELLGVGAFTPYLQHRYGRLLTVVAASDGALWLTTSNRDGHGHPVPTDERVIRYLPGTGGGHSPV